MRREGNRTQKKNGDEKAKAFPSREQKGAYSSVKNVKLIEDRAQKAKQLLEYETASGPVRH